MKALRGTLVFALILGLATLMLGSAIGVAELMATSESGQEDIPIVAPMNEEFLELQRKPYLIELLKYSDDGYPLGFLPGPHDFSYLKEHQSAISPNPQFYPYGIKGKVFFSNKQTSRGSSIWIESIPASYDLRNYKKLTAVKNQGNCGSCWAFATYGSLESFLLPSESWDFSEQNLIDEHGFDYGPCAGGSFDMSAAYLGRWSGPIEEISDPYIYSLATDLKPMKHVQEIVYLPPRSGPLSNNLIKQSIIAYGAVSTDMYYKSIYYNGTYKTYYNPGIKEGAHLVAIVGWDDSFNRSRFNYIPPGNGAFIVRNSWGADWGDSGYFYVSYYDEFFARKYISAVFKAEIPTDYEINYQYDYLGWTNSLGYSGSDSAWMSNIFISSSNIPLKAVGFYTAASRNNYEIYIYTDVSSGQPTSGNLRSIKKGQINSPGYHTVILDSPVGLRMNQRFSAVLKLRTIDYDYPLPIEQPIYKYSGKARANAGESFISTNGSSWNDLHTSWGGIFWNSNVCLKAFAGLPPLYPPVNLRIEMLENNLIFFKEYINKLTWESNTMNVTGVQKYKIYRKIKGSSESSYQVLVEVPGSALSYDDRGLRKDELFSYRVTTIDEYNRESEPVELSN
jgi:C1A family cysteine protease